MGCGVACVAFVVGRSYANALQLFSGFWGDPHRRGYGRRTLVAALRRAGESYVVRGFGRVPPDERARWAFPEGSIVFVRDDGDYRVGHYLVRVGTYWMNPWDGAYRRALPAPARSWLYPE